MSAKKPFQLQIRYVLLPLLFALMIYAVYLATYLGAFKTVSIQEKNAGPFHLLFKTHVGPYHKINQLLQDVETWAKTNSLDCRLSFGEYLDNPEVVDEKRLRANVGCVLTEPLTIIPDGFQQKTIAEQKFVQATFSGASSIGPLKVYPRVKEYFQKINSPFPEQTLEIYELHSEKSMTTQYYFALSSAISQ